MPWKSRVKKRGVNYNIFTLSTSTLQSMADQIKDIASQLVEEAAGLLESEETVNKYMMYFNDKYVEARLLKSIIDKEKHMRYHTYEILDRRKSEDEED